MEELCGTMNGCHCRMCRNFAASLKRMRVERYPTEHGEVRLDGEQVSGVVCGFASAVGRKNGKICMEGCAPLGGELRLVAVADSMNGLQEGDIVYVAGENILLAESEGEAVAYRVHSLSGSAPCVAVLLPR